MRNQAESQWRVLVVEDDIPSAQLLDRILRHEGFEVEMVHSGPAALDIVQREPFDVIILDAMLPGLDGYQVARRMRENPLTRQIPILMLTARGDISDRIAGFEAGVDDYLTKPYEPDELVYRVRALLARAARAQKGPLWRPAGLPKGHVVAFFGTKGGVGKTLIAVNTAVMLAQRMRALQKRVVLFDTDFFFGDVAIHLNLPTNRSIVDLLDQVDSLDEYAEKALQVHEKSDLHVLISPYRPEDAELITPEVVDKVLTWLAERFDFVIVDCPPAYDDRILTIFDHADTVILVVTPEIGPLKNMSMFLELAPRLGIPLDHVFVVLNRANSNVGVELDTIERVIGHKVAFQIISGGRPVVLSVNRGVPFVLEAPNHILSRQIKEIADFIAQQGGERQLAAGSA